MVFNRARAAVPGFIATSLLTIRFAWPPLKKILDSGDEKSVAWQAAQDLYSDAVGRFADAEPTTLAGALAKLKAINEGECLDHPDRENDSIARHYKTIVAYLERLAAAPVSEHDPAVIAAGAFKAAADASNVKHPDPSAWEDSPEFKAIDKRFNEADKAFASAVPTTPAGAIAKLKGIISYSDLDDYAEEHCNTIIAYLEKAAGAGAQLPVTSRPGQTLDASFADTPPEPANDSGAGRFFPSRENLIAAATVFVVLALGAIFTAFERGKDIAIQAGLTNCP